MALAQVDVRPQNPRDVLIREHGLVALEQRVLGAALQNALRRRRWGRTSRRHFVCASGAEQEQETAYERERVLHCSN